MFEEKDFFLNVEKSVGGRAWIDRLSATQMRTATAMSQQYGISEILARILAGRDVPLDATEEFLLPTLRDLMPDPQHCHPNGCAGGALGTGRRKRRKRRFVWRL